MKVLQVAVSTVVLLSLAACSDTGLGSKRIDYRAGADQVSALEIPPDLTAPVGNDRYRIRAGEGETVATYSDYSKQAGTPGASGGGTVLPEVKGVRLEREGGQRWLVVDGAPEKVWPIVKTFWLENGLPIDKEDATAGVMETVWVENRAKIPMDFIRETIGKAFDNIYSSGERDQYLTRLERGKDGVSTAIFITHRGKEEVMDKDKAASKWQNRPNDPELEAIMLQKLMVRLGGSEDQAAAALAGAATSTPQLPPGPASLRDGVITVGDPFDKAWHRVGLAIEDAGLTVEDRDRAKGIYFLRQAKQDEGWLESMKIWKTRPDPNKHYRVNVKDGGASSEVTVTDQNGATDSASAEMIEAIYGNIGR